MSFIRLLALSYFAWAAVFVVAVVLVAHLPLPGIAIGGSGAPAVRSGTARSTEARKVARLVLTPVPPIPTPPPIDDVRPPALPVAQEPERKPDLSRQSPPVAVVAKPVSSQAPAARPQPRPMARLDLAPPVPVPRPHGAVPLPRPRVVQEPPHKTSLPQQRVAALPEPPLRPRPPEPAPATSHPAPAKPTFHIPDPPPSSLANLPDHLQPRVSQNNKRVPVEPAFHIPDPPPLEPGRL